MMVRDRKFVRQAISLKRLLTPDWRMAVGKARAIVINASSVNAIFMVACMDSVVGGRLGRFGYTYGVGKDDGRT
jgi:hypothetical protein